MSQHSSWTDLTHRAHFSVSSRAWVRRLIRARTDTSATCLSYFHLCATTHALTVWQCDVNQTSTASTRVPHVWVRYQNKSSANFLLGLVIDLSSAERAGGLFANWTVMTCRLIWRTCASSAVSVASVGLCGSCFFAEKYACSWTIGSCAHWIQRRRYCSCAADGAEVGYVPFCPEAAHGHVQRPCRQWKSCWVQEQASKCRSRVARCLFIQPRHGRYNICQERVESKNAEAFRRGVTKFRSLITRYLKVAGQWSQIFQYGCTSIQVIVFPDSDWGGDQEIRKSWDSTHRRPLFKGFMRANRQ